MGEDLIDAFRPGDPPARPGLGPTALPGAGPVSQTAVDRLGATTTGVVIAPYERLKEVEEDTPKSPTVKEAVR
jgi:hypothetical protein